MLSIVLDTLEEQVQAALEEAVRQELVERLDGSYKFIHDRVQEAAYSLIAEESRAAAHLRIVRIMAAHTPQQKREEVIFEIVNQFNRGVRLITARDEREQLAELNLIAGKRAKASTAYASALTYLDPASLATLEVLTKVFAAAMYIEANLACMTICRAVNLSLERGNCDGSTIAYVMLGAVAGARFGDYGAAFRFGQLGYELVEQRRLGRFQARVYNQFGTHVLPWTRHVKTAAICCVGRSRWQTRMAT